MLRFQNGVEVILVRLLWLLLLIAVTSGIVEAQQPGKNTPVHKSTRVIPKVSFASGMSALKIPFELFGNLVLLQVRVNDSDSLRFILDTGADTSVIDAQQAKALRLEPQGKIVGSGGGGTAEATFTKGVVVSLHGVQLLDQTIYVLPLESLSALGRKIDGIIGNDILKEFVVEIDYSAKTINLYEPQGYRYSGVDKIIPLMMDESLLFVHASITLEGLAPIEAKFEIDSGSTGAILLNTPFVTSHQVLTSVPKTIQTNIGGVGDAAKTLIGRVKGLRLGQFVIDHPITRFSQATRGDYASSKYDGLIGGEILRRFKVIFDYSRRRMILEPNPHFAESYEIDMSGIALVADGDDLLIDDVDENSSAAKAGIQGGDILVAINGRPEAEFTLDQIRTMFRQDGKEYLLSLKRDGKVLQLKLKLKRII
jgi:aspartyl protease/PDZ domain-containing protein